ncbi:MAG TPA: hypothetical protein VNF99_18625 [Stellaceae bacterium]|nr:hypothetical protein [Stellaceae bacterium]
MGRYDYQYDHASEPMEHDPEQTIEHAMGDVIIAFEELDDAIAGAISGILNRGDEVGRIVTAQLSFRNKVDMFGALIKFDRPDSVIATLIDGLCAGLLSVETVRNEIVHSKWRQDFTAGIQRSKFTARVKHGLKETKETWHPGHSAAEARALSTTRNAGVGYVSA